MDDVMLLRKLYLTKRHLLRARRDDLIASTREQMPHLHPSENVARMADLADQLKQNASEDQQLLYFTSRAFYCGVSTVALAVVCHFIVTAVINAVMMHAY